MSLGANSRSVDLLPPGQDGGAGQHVPGAGGERELGLVGYRGRDATGAEGVYQAGGNARLAENVGLCHVRGRDAKAAGHHHHDRPRPLSVRQEQLAKDLGKVHGPGIGDGLEVVQRVSGRDPERLAHPP